MQRSCLSGNAQDQESMHWPEESGKLCTNFETFNESFNFPSDGHLFMLSRLIKFLLPCQVNLQIHISLKRVNY